MKKFLALFLTFCLLFTLSTGCSKKQNKHYPKTCKTCNGVGHIPCPDCDNVDCLECENGTYYYGWCSECNGGNKQMACFGCFGKGSNASGKCTWCNGKGVRKYPCDCYNGKTSKGTCTDCTKGRAVYDTCIRNSHIINEEDGRYHIECPDCQN